ncbi:hypothetical protein TIFTF001_015428 [Ficus carica]|uniref:Uncharacterized protein n=1 Tax=Ficus carica TaxID=3494 RepID=A0AA88AHR2_FICCA|nr:hypothetical protein TIFTF001_015428 [Ficus carica]
MSDNYFLLGFKIGVGVSELGLGFGTKIEIQGRDQGSGLKLGFKTRVGSGFGVGIRSRLRFGIQVGVNISRLRSGSSFGTRAGVKNQIPSIYKVRARFWDSGWGRGQCLGSGFRIEVGVKFRNKGQSRDLGRRGRDLDT